VEEFIEFVSYVVPESDLEDAGLIKRNKTQKVIVMNFTTQT
jgi:hypothetical protein